MSARAFALFGCALLALAACGDDGDGNDTAATAQNLRCTVNEVRMCPCIGQGMGTQTCNAEGTGYSACTGCPAPTSAGSGGSGPMAMAGSTAPGTAGSAGSGMSMAGASANAGMGGAGGAAGSGTAGAAGGAAGSAAGSGSEPTPSAGTAPGVSCGVGLPSLCALETEKCCVRSLQTDTCIGASETCSCSLQGCTVMEARCDGPEDCPSGQVCCGTLSQNGMGYDRFVCATQCMSTGNQRIACHDDMKTCTGNNICANSQLLTNVQVCIDPATIEQ